MKDDARLVTREEIAQVLSESMPKRRSRQRVLIVDEAEEPRMVFVVEIPRSEDR